LGLVTIWLGETASEQRQLVETAEDEFELRTMGWEGTHTSDIKGEALGEARG
jgi:hypothetical protein